MSELVEDGDEVVAIRVLELDEGGEPGIRYSIGRADIIERHDPTALSDFREEAHEILRNMLEKNDEAESRKVSRGRITTASANDQISVVVEMVAGPVPDMLLKMIALYRPDCESALQSTRSKLS
jgi:hypothetical protein